MELLSTITFLPLLGGLVILCVPKEKVGLIRGLAIFTTAATFAASLFLLGGFDPNLVGESIPKLQYVEQLNWIPSLGVHYFMGVDGLSVPIILLTTLLSFLAAIYSIGIETRVKEFFFWYLLLEVGMIGVFCAMDLFLFYLFWELTLVPMYFLIGVWGGPKKEFAAIKFFLFTLFGSVFMLLGILALYFASTPHTFNMLELMQANGSWSRSFQIVVFIAFYLGLAVKIPAFPFHTWLPLAHVEAPTPVSVILAGVLLKMGVYGLIRISYSILPAGYEWFLPYLIIIAFINIVYGALCAMAQTDMKKMVAYSSVNHMGYCLLGLAAVSTTGFNGAIFQMITHGIITGALFLLVGVLYDRAHTRDITAFGGLGAKLPVYSGIMALTCFASLGLPGLAGFVGEFMCFLGAFAYWKFWTTLSVAGILITAAFFLRMMQKVFLGPFNEKWKDLPEINLRELIAVGPLAVLTVLFGVWPQLILGLTDPTVKMISNMYEHMFQLVR
ncbi:MAG: oxidoreductase [Elusimicrobia bacterium CG1_02_63_36]|nr:MAG: oxidoreductase [Elusimicrobia bacterium CG1_02_63_36]PIP82409.1 MAG: oxidoreductase [Elusimicrobia bacterium CG22_combo_CG10-13_8_21_14_all_63_91]PJA17600.1 MAG: oxidoreductase [Elusimicrobia bacterium CG_4_10_14_0_2_um_filter_63_34]PJB26557.1 MAG: oxidoreductase [Elusimicrobia bacterium CG_4_9_14_3_um_filter_62_55]